MAKTLEWVLIGVFTSIYFLKFWTHVRKGQQQSEVRAILEWQWEEVIKLQEVLKAEQVLNKNQCENLLKKLHLVVYYFQGMIKSTKETSNLGLVLEELCHIIMKVQILVEDCGKEEWCRAIAFQMNNREAFRELVCDLQCFWDAICEIYSPLCADSQYDIPYIDFSVATYVEIQDDEKDVEKRLLQQLIILPDESEEYELAKYLLRRVQFDLQFVKGAELDALEVPMDFKQPRFVGQIGFGSGGQVYKSSWLGLESATKVMTCNPSFYKEAGIIAGLSHPNIIKFFGCGIVENLERSLDGTLEISKEQYIVMEFMEMSLGDFLKKQKTPLSYIVAIDVMYQIAKGMCYLHDMFVAHLDVKPDNVLVNYMTIARVEGNCGYHFVKLMDYGTSKVDVRSEPDVQQHTIGTPKYMAPEMSNHNQNDPPSVASPFQADVWSFAMTCSEILSCTQPFSNIKYRKDIIQNIKEHVRPNLPIDCKELTMLIEECWVEDPSQRPTFADICARLATLKKKFMIGTYLNDIPRFNKDGAISQTMERKLRVTKHVMNICATEKVDEPTPNNKVLVGRDSILTKVRNRLTQVKILGLVGMGGIGKTTLAKALFDGVKSTYNASCFVEHLKNRSSHEILCEVLQKLGSLHNETKPDLVVAQKMMRELLTSKKIILILDDPLDQDQVDDIILVDAQFVNKNTNIIMTTRNWGVIKKCVEENGRIDVGRLDGSAAKKLFDSYASLDDGHLSSEFFDIHDKIVEACKGLPLSLEVMGAFLRGKERLRSWERAFQRIKRGRCLDGDEGLWSTLKISFDELQEKEKRLFLDIACFFPMGWWKERILRICTCPIDVLDRLVTMSFVKINKYGFLEMHDQLCDMGRMIVETNEEYMGTRIWRKDMIPLTNASTNKNYKKVESILLNEEILPSLFNIDTGIVHFKFSCVRLLICKSLTTLPEGLGNLSSLETLNFSWCWSLTTLPEGLGNLTSLTTFHVFECSSLTTLPEGLGNLIYLITFHVSDCSSLKTLPEGLGNLASLTTLDLSWCSSLTMIPEGLGKLTSLTTLNLYRCLSLRTLPEGLGNLTSLTTLDLSGCSSLTTLPKGLENLISLTTFQLSECSRLTTLLKGFWNLTSLTTLNLSWCSGLTTLPKGFGNLTLKTLNLSGCSSLTTLPVELWNLTSLTTLDLSKSSSLTTLPEELGNLISLTTLNLSGHSTLTTLPEGFGNLTSLITLDLSWCWNLTTLPHGLGNLTSLTTFNMSECWRLTTLPEELINLSSLTTVDLSGCSSLTTLPKGLGNLTSLTTFHLSRCQNMTTLPRGLENLIFLTTFNLSGCSSMMTLLEGLGNLIFLTTLDLSGCLRLTTLPKGLGNLTSLITLDLSKCWGLITLPEGLGNLTSLTTLHLSECSSLRTLPEELGNLKSLTTLRLSECSRLTTLPEGFGKLTSLATLDLSGCSSLITLPRGLANLTLLRTFCLSGCSRLITLPKELENLTSLTTLDLFE